MDEIWNYLAKSPILVITFVVAVALVFSWVFGRTRKEVRPEDLVPHYRRFERREPEFGDRRKAKMDAKAKAQAEAEQRKIGRRESD